MSVTVIPTNVEAPSIVASTPLTPGQLLSARERGAVSFREKVQRELSGNGPKRSSDHLVGYRHGWDACCEHLRMMGAIR